MFSTAVLAAIVVAGLVATPTLAAGRSPGSTTIVACTSPAPDVSGVMKVWDAGRTTHIRGWTASYTATGDTLCAGTVEVVAGIEVTNGVGGLRGTVVYRLAGIDGGWIGTFEQVWAYGRGQLTYGREIATGFGALAGWQLRGTLNEAFDGTIVEIDEVFAPGM
jgi:hypothetical protein